MRLTTLVLLAQAAVGVQVDGIAAIVNEEVLSIGEVERAAAMLARREGPRPAVGCGSLGAAALEIAEPERPGNAEVTDETWALALECLIDGMLVFREVRRFPQLEVTPEAIEGAYAMLAERFPSPEALAAELERVGLTPEALRRDLRRQLLIEAYVDSRFRTTVDVSEEEARRYYDETLAPGMRSQGIEPPPFAEVRADYVTPILREREVNRRVESWIQDLRARAEIIVRQESRQ